MSNVVVPFSGNQVADYSSADVPAEGRSGSITNAEHYSYGGLPRFGAEDRPYIDQFARYAASVGLSQREFEQATSWALQNQWRGATEGDFVDAMIDLGWRDAEIRNCLQFHRQWFHHGIESTMNAAPGGGRDAQRLAEIRSQMGDRGPYWRDEAMQAEYRQILARMSK
jgi:hypothetical protein